MTDGADLKRIRRISFRVGVIGVTWLLLPLRIKQPEFHQIVSLFSFWCVLLAFGIAVACLPARKWLRAIGSIPFFLAAAIFPLFMLLASIAGVPIVGFEILDTVELKHSRVVAYRLNGGATTGYAIKVSQELSVFPGVVVAKDLRNGYHEYTASLKALPSSVVITIDGVLTEHNVHPFIYF